MPELRYIAVFVGMILCQAWVAVQTQDQCSEIKLMNGTISHSAYVRYQMLHRLCWKIQVPSNHFIRLTVQSLNLPDESCQTSYLQISIKQTNEKYTFCRNSFTINPITALTEVDVVLNVLSSSRRRELQIDFILNYEIKDIECALKDSFHCTDLSCIPKTEVCDGVKDCENGADEVGCETGISSIPGVTAARLKGIVWLKSKRTSSWGWQENTPRAVTALFLAGAANFSGTILEEELMAKQMELKTAVALLKDPVSNEQLSMFINALLVTCHSPRHFYGQDLIKRLKEQIESSSNFTHPIAYLALCNANESWPMKAVTQLNEILRSDSEYPFVKDIQAFAVMAISCHKNRTKLLNKTENSALTSQYQSVITRFKDHQFSDGSFGNVHTTSLIAQALISSGQEHAKDWKLNATIKYLISELNSTNADFLAHYLALPILNRKSLADIIFVNCSGYPRQHGDGNYEDFFLNSRVTSLKKYDLVSEINDYTGSKMRVQYSLFVGDEKDVIHTISLRVPENFTAYEVMQLAEVQDYKYKFQWKNISGKMYVFEIGKMINDPEAGMFWLLYLGMTNATVPLQHLRSSPDELILKDNSHLIMWYRKAQI